MKKQLYIFIIISSLFLPLGCKKFVEIDPPNTKLIAGTVFQSDATANSALVAVYASVLQQTANPYNMALYTGLSGDELFTYSTGSMFTQAFTNRLNPTDALTNSIWSGAYNCIYQANAVIEGCKGSTTLSPAVQKQDIAEAKFMRSFWYFYLVNIYGPVPLIMTTDYSKNAVLPRTSSDEVYQQIKSDLTDAQQSLNVDYVDGSSTATGDDRVRANQSAATALLARVYLYNKQYAEAEREAGKLIENSTLYQILPLDDVFKKNSKESILQLMMPLPASSNTPDGAGFVLTAKPGTGPTRSSTLSQSLFTAFEPGDLRKDKWVGKVTDKSVTPNVDYYFPYKYKVASGGATITEHSMVLRLAEQYLIRAEARAQQNNLNGAIEDLDVIRKRAGIPLIIDINPSIEKDDLLNLIFKERRVEFFTEWGHRWLDIKRIGKVDQIMNTEAIAKGTTWDTRKQLFPIPQKDLDNNRSLIQNAGYIQ